MSAIRASITATVPPSSAGHIPGTRTGRRKNHRREKELQKHLDRERRGHGHVSSRSGTMDLSPLFEQTATGTDQDERDAA